MFCLLWSETDRSQNLNNSCKKAANCACCPSAREVTDCLNGRRDVRDAQLHDTPNGRRIMTAKKTPKSAPAKARKGKGKEFPRIAEALTQPLAEPKVEATPEPVADAASE